MKLTDDQSIPERIAVLEIALEKLLDRDSNMCVEPSDEPGTLAVYVDGQKCYGCVHPRTGWSLNTLARELEVLLS